MSDGIKPSTIMLIAGGAVMLFSTFLDWRSKFGSGINGWEIDAFGLLGIFVALIGLLIAGAVAVSTFTNNVNLPDELLGFTLMQLYASLGATAFLITLGTVFVGDTAIGLWLGVLSSGVVVAGAIMEMQSEPTGGGAAPTQF